MARWLEHGGAQRCVRTAPIVGGALNLCGCVAIGPRSITAGRGAYAEVINRTEDEQILNVIVRQRYDETFGMISVTSVTASLGRDSGEPLMSRELIRGSELRGLEPQTC
jgi:hypothetical protein